MADPATPNGRPSGFGALLRTEYDHVDLGSHRGRSVRARVQRRSLRLALGRGRHVSVGLGRTRPVSIEITGEEGRYDVPVPAPSDPWVRAAWRLALLCVASVILVRIVRRVTGRTASSEGVAPHDR